MKQLLWRKQIIMKYIFDTSLLKFILCFPATITSEGWMTYQMHQNSVWKCRMLLCDAVFMCLIHFWFVQNHCSWLFRLIQFKRQDTNFSKKVIYQQCAKQMCCTLLFISIHIFHGGWSNQMVDCKTKLFLVNIPSSSSSAAAAATAHTNGIKT